MKRHIPFLAAILWVASGCAATDGMTEALSPAMQTMTDAGTTLTDAIPATPRFTHVVAIADPHIVQEDDDHARNLRAIGQTIADMPWDIAGAFVAGDIVYNLPYETIDEYHADPNDRFDVAQAIFDDFPVPVYPALGNHDLADRKSVV